MYLYIDKYHPTNKNMKNILLKAGMVLFKACMSISKHRPCTSSPPAHTRQRTLRGHSEDTQRTHRGHTEDIEKTWEASIQRF